MITHGGRHAAKQRGHFRTSLRKPENVVDEEQHVESLIAEVLGDRESRKRNAQTRAGRLRHLTVNQRHFRLANRVHVDFRQIERASVVEVLVELFAKLDNLRLNHFAQQVVSFARSLAHATEHGFTTVSLGDVVDQLLNDDGLADAGAAEETDLSALHEGSDEIDDLDSRLEDFGLRFQRDEVRALSVNRPAFDLGGNRRTVVDRLAEDVENSA